MYCLWGCYNMVSDPRFDYLTLRALHMCDLHMKVSLPLIGGVPTWSALDINYISVPILSVYTFFLLVCIVGFRSLVCVLILDQVVIKIKLGSDLRLYLITQNIWWFFLMFNYVCVLPLIAFLYIYLFINYRSSLCISLKLFVPCLYLSV